MRKIRKDGEMVKRVNISVPDELYERMQKWRKQVNFSSEFQKMVSKLIDQKEDLMERLGDEEMAQAILRLREEKMEEVGDYGQFGFNDGMEWASQAHYSELKAALEWDPRDSPKGEDLEGLREHLDHMFTDVEEYNLLNWGECWTYPNNYNDMYLSGFKEGIEDFWDKVKDQV